MTKIRVCLKYYVRHGQGADFQLIFRFWKAFLASRNGLFFVCGHHAHSGPERGNARQPGGSEIKKASRNRNIWKKKATSFRVRRNSVTPTPGRLFYSRITFTERAKGKLKGRRGVQQNCRKGVRYELQALFVVQKACAKDRRTCYATTQGTLLPPGQRPGTIMRRVPEALKISRRRPSNPQLRGVQVHGQFLWLPIRN